MRREPRGEETERRFAALALPHLDAAFNLARWLTRNDHDAEDVVQEAFIRALRYMEGFRGDNARSWLLQIVRNTCFTWLKANRPAEVIAFEDHADLLDGRPGPAGDAPQMIALRHAERLQIDEALASMPIVFREILVLRELEDCSYGEIARIAELPLGTVMSRLARGRALLRMALQPAAKPALRAVPRTTYGGSKR